MSVQAVDVEVEQLTLFSESVLSTFEQNTFWPGCSVRYLGSKARVVPAILPLVGTPNSTYHSFVDLFSGTGIVSRAAATRGWKIRANDHLVAASFLTRAELLGGPDVQFLHLGGYKAALQVLQSTPPVEGFIYREYAPSGRSRSDHQRFYFTLDNAQSIDGMRLRIEEWSAQSLIDENERTLLISDLLVAASAVSNTAGTYGCFLRHWTDSALRAIRLVPRKLMPRSVQFEVTALDAFDVVTKPGDVLYLDPPYTKRHYAAYYHLMETIALYDAPVVGGVTGLRPWEHKASPFCYKRRALAALVRLISTAGADRVLLSYSSEGHVELEALREGLATIGPVTVHRLEEIGRYRPNVEASENGTSVTEFLLEIDKRPLHVSR